MESIIDQTVNAHGVIAVSAVIGHVQNLSPYHRAQVTSLFQQGYSFLLLFLSSVKCYDLNDSIISWIQSDIITILMSHR